MSFFAYAPYAAVTASTGVPTQGTESGIIAVSKNSDPGDPTVTYKLTTDGSANVDLLWVLQKQVIQSAKTNGTTVAGTNQNGNTLTGGKVCR